MKDQGGGVVRLDRPTLFDGHPDACIGSRPDVLTRRIVQFSVSGDRGELYR